MYRFVAINGCCVLLFLKSYSAVERLCFTESYMIVYAKDELVLCDHYFVC